MKLLATVLTKSHDPKSQRARRARRVNSSAPIHRYTDTPIYPPCPDRRIGVPAYRRISCPDRRIGVFASWMGVSAYRRIGVPAYRRIGVSAYFLPGSAYRHIGVFASWMGASENQGRPISPRVHPRRSGVVRVLILKSGAPHQSQGPSSESRGGQSSDLKKGASSVPGSILGDQGW